MSSLFLSANYAQVKISGELRIRTEVDHGSKFLPEENAHAAIYTAQRSRLNLDYKDENITYKTSLMLLILQNITIKNLDLKLI